MEWYDGLYAELFTSLHMRRNDPALYHFLFTERDFRYLPALRSDRGHKIICTFHTTPDEFTKVMKYTEHLKSIDAAIIVSRNQAPLLESIIGSKKVFFIPHGVDTKYFTPLPQEHQSKKICLSVGHHHRDFETLARVAAIIRKRDPDVRFIVVNRVFSVYLSSEQQRSLKELFSAAGNVELRNDLTDDELLRLYQTSDLMVLPLFDTTANVAVLEALSCGLPMVVTDVGGIRDYIEPEGAAFAARQDAEMMANHVMRLLQNPGERKRLSRSSRSQALTFDWRHRRSKSKRTVP